MSQAAIILGKSIFYITRLLKIGGGSAAPGLYALKVDPDLVKKLSSKIPKNIVITGTNGKTTTTGLISHFAKASGFKAIRNHTGSNLERGIASTLINHTNIFGKIRDIDLGIWELDEAAFNTVAPKLKPDIIIFLNAFRDQLDRYGEVDTVVKKWRQLLANLPKETVILLNGDDANIAKLKPFCKGKTYMFGVKDYKIMGEGLQKKAENLDFEAKNVAPDGLKGSSFQLTINHKPLTINLPLPGIYNIYNFLAAFGVGEILGIPEKMMTESLNGYLPSFGRVEKIILPQKKQGYIFLIKNPVGASQVFQTLAPNIKEGDRLLLALNDNLADGTDVSWIWDANFEKLLTPSLRAQAKQSSLDNNPTKIATEPEAPRNDISVIVSGTRAYDLTLRLKYAGFDPKRIIVEPSLEKALEEAGKSLKGTLYILPTYTAMLGLQKILTKIGAKKHYWKEE